MKEDEVLTGTGQASHEGKSEEKETKEGYITDQGAQGKDEGPQVKTEEAQGQAMEEQGNRDEAEKPSQGEEEGQEAGDGEAELLPLVTELKTKLEEAEKKAEENFQRLLRVQADFENFRRRTRKEKEELQQYAAQAVIEQLLPVMDNFERALEAGRKTDDKEALIKGIEMVYNQFQQVLKDQGLETIDSVGKPFDPYVHEAVMQVESDQYQSGYVVEELQKGYKLKDRVIRPAMVKVSQ